MADVHKARGPGVWTREGKWAPHQWAEPQEEPWLSLQGSEDRTGWATLRHRVPRGLGQLPAHEPHGRPPAELVPVSSCAAGRPGKCPPCVPT